MTCRWRWRWLELTAYCTVAIAVLGAVMGFPTSTRAAVATEIVPEVSLDAQRVRAVGDLETGRIQVEAPLIGADRAEVGLSYRVRGDGGWSPEQAALATGGTLDTFLTVENPLPWSPESPTLYEVRVHINDPGGDEVVTRAAFRSIRVDGNRLLLNGRPRIIRGLLNVGTSPPSLFPRPEGERFREDIAFALERGFNLMKFHHWIPPKRDLDLCDELGMLVWMDYPAVSPTIDPAQREGRVHEHAGTPVDDRDHPAIILRSQANKSSPTAALDTNEDRDGPARAMVPGTVVEDDHGGAVWRDVNDRHDDHPFDNDHEWARSLERLKASLSEQDSGPLVLGAAMAADTWLDRDAMLELYGGERPPWFPGFFDANARWLERMLTLYGPSGLNRLIDDSKQQAMRLRKSQIEAFRRAVSPGRLCRPRPARRPARLDRVDRPARPAEVVARRLVLAGADDVPAPVPRRSAVLPGRSGRR